MEDFLRITIQWIQNGEGSMEEIAYKIRDYLYSGDYSSDTGTACDISMAPFEDFVRDIKCV